MKYNQDYTDLQTEVNDLGDKLPPANIIIAGITGSGKSTLINAIFGQDLAKTGIGGAVTSKIDVYEKDGVPVKVWDTVGLELKKEVTEETIANVREIIRQKHENKKDKFDRIHAIWYCIQSVGHRFQSEEVKFIKSLYNLGVPFIIVITKCISSKKDQVFEKSVIDILNENNMDIQIVRVLAEDWELDEDVIIKAKGLTELVSLTADNLPKFICDSFIAAQQADKVIKREKAEEVIIEYICKAKKSILNKIPILSLFVTNGSAKKMFQIIGKLYNTELEEHDIETIYEAAMNKLSDNQLQLLIPIGSFPEAKKVFDTVTKEDGFTGSENDFTSFEKSAQLIAYAGYAWVFSIEAFWDELIVAMTKEDRKKIINKMVANMKAYMNKK